MTSYAQRGYGARPAGFDISSADEVIRHIELWGSRNETS